MSNEYITENVEATIHRWMCRCGGEYKRIGEAVRVVNPPQELAGRGYVSNVYPHKCTRCFVISDNIKPYPLLAPRPAV